MAEEIRGNFIDEFIKEMESYINFVVDGEESVAKGDYQAKYNDAEVAYVDADGNPDCNFHTAFMLMSNQESYGGYKDAYIKADYMLVNAANEDDLTYVTVIYDYAKYVAAVNKAGVNNNMNVSQRGANLVCNYAFDTVAERSLVVTNIVGARVASVALEGNNGEVAVERLPKGVYVYTLVEGGRNIKSQKIVVR